MSLYKKNKELIIIISILLIMVVINFWIGVQSIPKDYFDKMSGFSLWQYSLQYNLGTVLLLLSPQLIAIATVFPLYRKLKTGFIQNVAVRTQYKKYMKKEIFISYFKSLFVLPMISLLILLVGILLFGTKVNYETTSLLNFSAKNPILFVTLVTIGLILYGILSINLTLILARYINKFYLVLISLFLAIFFWGYIEGNFIYAFISTITSDAIHIRSSYFDLYFPSLSEINWIEIYGLGIIRILISTVLVYVLYHNEEKVLLDYEE